MAKLILNDRTEIADVIDVSIGGFSKECTAEQMAEIFDSLSDQNLEKFELQDEEGNTIAIYTDKHPHSCTYAEGTATFNLSDVSKTEKRLSALEDTIDMMILEDMGV